MMGIPPPSRDTSTTGTGRVSRDDREEKPKTDFTLKRKNQSELDKERDEAFGKLEGALKDVVDSLKNMSPEQKKALEEKLKELQKEADELKGEMAGIAAHDALASAKQLQAQAVELRNTAQIASADAAAAVSKTTEIIRRMASELMIGKDIASMRLKEAEVPSYLTGSTLVVQKTEAGVSITFQGMTPAQAREAKLQMEGNQHLLDRLAADLQNKNITVSSINLGGHETVALTPPVLTAAATEQPQDRGGEREGGGQGGREEGEEREGGRER